MTNIKNNNTVICISKTFIMNNLSLLLNINISPSKNYNNIILSDIEFYVNK